jgi:glycerol-3-phosphate dehydrogenase
VTNPPARDVVALSPARALADTEELGAGTFDVLVIGGGVVGAGVALDAATRGLSVALVEAVDWAAGTSSRSSKLIHGGLRYVQSRDLALVREALRERSILLGLAPHLVRPAEFLYPLRHRASHAYVGAGVGIYDLLARSRREGASLPRARHLGARSARALAPGLRPGRLVGGVVYYDAQVDDARFVLSLVRTAASFGARVVSRARVVGLTEEQGQINGARVQLLETGQEVEVRAGSIVGATGVWTEEIAAMSGEDGPKLRPSKGVHLLLAREAIDAHTALIIPTSTSVLFILPWGAHWIVGTTDTAWAYDPDRPVATRADVDFLLGELNAVLDRPVGRDAVESVYVGLRPLLWGEERATTKLSREHAIAVPRPGLSLVTGGKFTTYRVMAKDALDAALASAGIDAAPCRTADVPLAGADRYAEVAARREALTSSSGLAPGEVDGLLGRFGSLVDELFGANGIDNPLVGLRGAPGYLRAEVAYAVSHEGARHLDDVLVRRTRAAIETADRGLGAAEEVAAVMAPLLGWDANVRALELAAYRASVNADLLAEASPDDAAAEAALAELGAASDTMPLPAGEA